MDAKLLAEAASLLKQAAEKLVQCLSEETSPPPAGEEWVTEWAWVDCPSCKSKVKFHGMSACHLCEGSKLVRALKTYPKKGNK